MKCIICQKEFEKLWKNQTCGYSCNSTLRNKNISAKGLHNFQKKKLCINCNQMLSQCNFKAHFNLCTLQKPCKQCGKIMTKHIAKTNQFCCHSCAASYSNKNRVPLNTSGVTKYATCIDCNVNITIPLQQSCKKARCTECRVKYLSSPEHRIKVNLCMQRCYNKRQLLGNKVTTTYTPRVARTYSRIYYHCCIQCNKKVISKFKKCKKFCSKECRNINLLPRFQEIGRINAAKSVKRSKNEIMFAELCQQKFQNVVTNQPIFNGWDADVILTDQKIAVLWNGIWHHKKIKQNHSLAQVQNRDRIKLKEIAKAGYMPYVVDDFGMHNPKFVIKQFELFLKNIQRLEVARMP